MLSFDEKEHMMDEIKKATSVLYDFITEADSGSVIAHENVSELLMSLSSNSPVCAYIHFSESVRSIIHDLNNGVNIKEDVHKWGQLREAIPMVYNMLNSPSCIDIPPTLVKLLVDLWNKTEKTFLDCRPVEDSSPTDDNDEMVFFPTLPKVRNRGKFSADTKKNSVNDNCRKQYTGHPTLLPGIFTVYCPHGDVLLFEILFNI